MNGTTILLMFGGCLFTLGLLGALIRRNAILVLMSIELMLNGVMVTFVTFSRLWRDPTGQLFSLFVITVAACEAAVGLALLLCAFRLKGTVNVDEINLLKW